jgi:hypothetical protein
VFYGKRKQGDVSGPFDRLRHSPLMPGAVSRNARRHNFPSLGNQGFQKFYVKKIDVLDFIGTKPADFLCEQRSSFLVSHSFLKTLNHD